MKFISKNITKQLSSLFIITIFSIALFSIFFPKKAYAKSSVCFARKYNILTIEKNVLYKIKNLGKTDYVRYSVSNPSLASIGKKSGLMTPKKAGKLTVNAVIYNKKHKRLKTLTNNVTIQQKKQILPNAVFKVNKGINPWNFTISLSCSRILLKKEIQADKLTITPKGRKSPKLTASFTSLSADGKEIIYTLNTSGQTKLCPGNSSMDGTYTLESLRFSKKLSLNYKERLTENTLSGFVLNSDGNSVKHALVTLKKGTVTLNKCHTDENGHYKLQNVQNADCLTVEKTGFKKNTLYNPAISSKGTTCENIILRSSKETDVAMDFLITDKKNNPIPNTSIYILEQKDTAPSQTPFPDTTEQISAVNCMADYIPKEKILYSGATDSGGRLLLSNSPSSPSAPCSNLTLGEETLVSYSAQQKPAPNIKKEILPSSILDDNKNYVIYIKNYSKDNLQHSYHTKKILFSFTSLITDYAFLHVRLNLCQQTSLKDLSIISDTPPSLYRSLLFQFFHPDDKKAFYQYPVEKEHFKMTGNKILSSSLLLPISLPEDTYYLKIQALSEESNILSQSDFVICYISNSTAFLEPITLQKAGYARLLVYGNREYSLSSKASFELYQKYDGYYFYIGNYFTDIFTKKDKEFSVSSLYLNNLFPNSDYLLVPLSGNIAAKEYLSFHSTNQSIFPAKEYAEHSLTPLATIYCIKTDLGINTGNNSDGLHHTDDTCLLSVPNDFYKDTITISYKDTYKISQHLVRTSHAYPNSVIAIYKPNGTFLTSTLTTSPTDNIAANKNNFSKQSIIDIYTNKRILITNQNSYKNYSIS